MSTRSLINIINKDGSLDSVYCNYDGFLEGNGLILQNYYQNINKIRQLLSKGGFTSLSDEVSEINYYNQDDLKMVHYNNMKEYLESNLESMIAYHYFYDEKANKWFVGFDDDKGKYHKKDLLQELKAQYYWEHNTDKFCCIVLNELRQKTKEFLFLHFLQQQEKEYHTKLHDIIYSDYFRESDKEDGSLVIYFEPEKFQKYLSVIQEVLNKHDFEYSITLVNEEGIKHLGTYQEDSSNIQAILAGHNANCLIYNELLIQSDRETSPGFI